MGLDTVELIMKIEDHFGIHILDEEAEQIATVADLYAAVARHMHLSEEELSGIKVAVNNIIADHAGLDLDEIQPYKSITSDLGLD